MDKYLMKKTLLTSLLISTISSAISCVSQPKIDYQSMNYQGIQQPVKEAKRTEQPETYQQSKKEQHSELEQFKEKQPETLKLYVNTDPTKHYSVKKSQSEGEKDLVELAKTSDIEEAWIFDTKEGIWYECGIKEKSSSVKIKYPATRSNIEDCILYHQHTFSEIMESKELHNELIKEKEGLISILKTPDLPQNIKEKTRKLLKKTVNSEVKLQTEMSSCIAFPSMPKDLKLCFRYGLKAAIVSEYGIIEFSNLISAEIFWEETNENWKKAFTKLKKEYYPVIKNSLKEKFKSESNFEDAIKYAVDKANKKFEGKLKLTYRPVISK